jgi:hypothetical protein
MEFQSLKFITTFCSFLVGHNPIMDPSPKKLEHQITHNDEDGPDHHPEMLVFKTSDELAPNQQCANAVDDHRMGTWQCDFHQGAVTSICCKQKKLARIEYK